MAEVIIIVAGLETGRFVFEPGDYVIGCAEACAMRVDAALVSHSHAKLILNCDHALIGDLGSSNGMRVNGFFGGSPAFPTQCRSKERQRKK